MAKFTIYHGAAGPIVAVGAHQVRLLEFVEKYRGWHAFGRDRATLRAVAGLERRGCLAVDRDTQQMRFTYPHC